VLLIGAGRPDPDPIERLAATTEHNRAKRNRRIGLADDSVKQTAQSREEASLAPYSGPGGETGGNQEPDMFASAANPYRRTPRV
jgi:hypothetical protein